MRAKQRNLIFVMCMVLASAVANAQTGGDWLENTMFASGKINVVVAVVAVLFALIVVYLISIDRKLKKMEENNKNNSL